MNSTVLAERAVGDVSQLPSVTFGDRSLMWWGTVGFMVIEGWTLALLVGVYLYLRQRNVPWPPLNTRAPDLGAATANILLMLLSIAPNMAACKAARRCNRKRISFWLVIGSVLGLCIVALRWPELWALNTRWDSHAYGSAVWVLVGFHTSLLVVDVADTLVLTAFFLFKELPVKALSDVIDNAAYWYFTIGSWLPVYLLIYLLPHFVAAR